MKCTFICTLGAALLAITNINAADPRILRVTTGTVVYYPDPGGSWEKQSAPTASGPWAGDGVITVPGAEFLTIPEGAEQGVWIRFRKGATYTSPFTVRLAGSIDAVVDEDGTGRARLHYPDASGGWRLLEKIDGAPGWSAVGGESAPGDGFITIPGLEERQRAFRFRKAADASLVVSEEFRVPVTLSIPIRVRVESGFAWRIGFIGDEIRSGYTVQWASVIGGPWHTVDNPPTGRWDGFFTLPDGLAESRRFFRLKKSHL